MTQLKTGTLTNEEWEKVQLEARIAPAQSRWPLTGWHWQTLHQAADGLRDAVAHAWRKNAAIENSPDVTPQAKRRQRAAVAMDAIAALAENKAVARAQKTAGDQLERWREKAAQVIKAPADSNEVALAAEIRRHVAGLKDKRLAWISAHASDPRVFSALLTAPAFLSGLDEAELGLVTAAAKAAADASLGPEIAEAKAATEKALADVERGHRVAMKLIAEAGSLQQDGGGWIVPPQAA